MVGSQGAREKESLSLTPKEAAEGAQCFLTSFLFEQCLLLGDVAKTGIGGHIDLALVTLDGCFQERWMRSVEANVTGHVRARDAEVRQRALVHAFDDRSSRFHIHGKELKHILDHLPIPLRKLDLFLFPRNWESGNFQEQLYTIFGNKAHAERAIENILIFDDDTLAFEPA